MFIGDDGTIVAGFLGQDPQLYAHGKREPLAAGSFGRPGRVAPPWPHQSLAAGRARW